MNAIIAIPLALAITSTVMSVGTFALASLFQRRENIFTLLCTWIFRFANAAAWLYGATFAACVAMTLIGLPS